MSDPNEDGRVFQEIPPEVHLQSFETFEATAFRIRALQTHQDQSAANQYVLLVYAGRSQPKIGLVCGLGVLEDLELLVQNALDQS